LFRRSLGKGSTGEEVRKLQEILSKDKNIYPEGLITGYYGNLTEKAVRKYQIQYNIALENDPGYGYVGPKTRAMLNQIK
jgi:peptidoglycan hydrolase-like protein with peptidoglycan-binding domain